VFTKQHYEAVARILKRQRKIEASNMAPFSALGAFGVIDDLTSEFATLFEGDNEAFNRKRFLEASGYKYDPTPVIERLDELEKMAKVAIDRA